MLKFIIIIPFLLFAISSNEYQNKLGIGIDVNWALHKKEIKYYSEKEVKDFKQKGFNTIRLRFKDKLTSKDLSHLDRIIKDCLNNDLNIVLSNSAQTFKNNPNNKTMEDLINLWTKIAKRYKNYPYSLSYDLIIEPGKALNKKKNLPKLNQFYKQLYREIRKIDKKRIIMFAPIKRSNPFYLKDMWIPENDKYVMAEWHMFAAGPKKSDFNRNKLNNKTKKEIIKKILTAYKWQKEHKIPTWIGAWMSGNYNHGNNISIPQQIIFSKFMIKTLNKYKIPCAINADQQFYNIMKKQFRQDRIEVLNEILKNPSKR
ncbi:MAG: hypothetical protein DSY40_02130 [Nautilia sp.]|nr:MAG: hypothetical protein DSY40_02130 [Nautilia sp.]